MNDEEKKGLEVRLRGLKSLYQELEAFVLKHDSPSARTRLADVRDNIVAVEMRLAELQMEGERV